MKNSPATSVSNSQRVRANAVWLMNAASLAIAIGAVNQVSKSREGNLLSNLVPTAQATDYYWTGSAALGVSSTTGAGQIGNTTGIQNMFSTAPGGGPAFIADIPATSAFSLATDNMYFNGTSSGWVNHGSNRAAYSINFAVGAGAYTFAPNSSATNRKFEITNGGKIENLSTIAAGQTFNSAIWLSTTVTGVNSFTVSAAANAKITFNGTTPYASYFNPYGSGTAANAAFGLTNSSTRTGILNIAGAGNIVINGAINDGGRQGTTGTNPFNAATSGGLTITSSGNTYLNGANSYTGGTTISNGMVYVTNGYAFGGNRAVDTTAPNWTATSSGYTGNAYLMGSGGTTATGFLNTTQAYKNVVLNSGTIDLSGTTMVGTYALTINGTGAASASGALQNSSATSATYAGAITLGSASTINAGTGNITLSGGLNTATYAATVSGAQNTSVTGVLSGTGSINKTGAGTLTLSGNNTYTGSINIEQGVVSLAAGSGSALGTGTAALSFGASNTPTLTLGGRSATVGSISSSNVNSVIQNNNVTAATFTSSAPGTSTFAGKLSDGAAGGKLSFVKAGNGTLTLSNTQDFTGTTTIAGGTLNLTGSTKTGSAVTVNSGATLSGSGTVNDSLTVSGSISPGAAGVGNLTAGATSLQSGGTLNVQIYNFSGLAGSTGWDLLTSTGAITVNSTADTLANKFNILLSSITGSGVDTVGSALNFTNTSNYTLKIFSGASISGFDASKFNITGSISNTNTGVWSVEQSGNDINLIYTAANAQFWNGATGWDASATAGGSGTWDSTGYSSSLDTFFAGTGAAVSVGTVTTSKAIKFQSDSYVLSNGTITLTGADSTTNKIDVGTGLTSTINSKIVSATSQINKTGLGTLVLGGANGSSGISSGISIVGGTIRIASADALGSSDSAVVVNSGTTLDLNGQSVTNTNTLNLSGTGAASAGGALINTSNNAASYAGLVTLGAATTINASSGSISLTNAGTITGSGFALTVDGASDTSISSIIGTGTAGITKTGNGTLTLSGVNTYTGATTVSAGRLKLANAGALGSSGSSYSATTIASGATLDLNGQSVANTNTLNLSGTGAASAGGALINTSNNAASYAGLVTLGAATTINASSGSISLTNAGTITGSGFGLTVTGGNDTSISSIIGTGAGTLTKTGIGTLTLSGANTYTGATTVSAGRLKVGNATALGGSAAGVTVASGATLDLNGQTISNTNVLTLSGTGADSANGALINTSNISASYAGNINLAADATIKATSGNITLANIGTAASRALTITGDYDTTITALTTGLTLNYIKNGTGILNLGANAKLTVSQANTHQINAGILRQSSTQPFGSSGTGVGAMTGLSITSVNIADGGSFDLNGLGQLKSVNVIMSGTGAAGAGGPIYNSSATTNAKFQGNFLMSGSTALISNNAGLELGASGSTGTGINLKNYDLTLGGTSTSAGNVISSILVGTGNLIKSGTGTWKLTPTGNSGFYYFDTSTSGAQYTSAANANIFTGSINISAGTLVMGNTGALGSSSGVTVANGGTLDLNGLALSTSNALTISGTGAAGAGGSIVNNAASSATYSGLITLNNDATINAQAGNINISGATLSSTNKTLTVAGSFNTNITSAMAFGSGGLTKTGTGSLTLSGANTYTGATNINGGKVILGNASALGDSSSNVVVSNGATLDLGGLSITNTNALSISGTGAGTAGATGALTSSSTTASYAGNITLADDATIYATAGDVILSGVISGNKQLTILNSSATKDVILTGASANTMGSINLAGYDLTFTAVNQLGSGTITSSSSNARLVYGTSAIGANATINITNQLNTGADSSKILALHPGETNSINASGLITGSGKLKVSGTGVGGVLYVTNTSNDFTGGIEIGTGTIQVADSRALGSGTINFGTSTASILSFTDSTTVANSLTMSGSSYTANIDVSSDKTATLSGVISPTTTGGKLTKTGNGSLVLSNTNTYSGATTISAGTLTLSGSGSIASSAVTVANSATLKATNSDMPASAVTGAITLNSGALVDLTEGSLKATSLTVAALSGSDVTKISYTIGKSFALTGGLTLNGNLSLDLTSALTGPGDYDVLTWTGAPTGVGAISFVNHSTADWTMTGIQTSGNYRIKVAAAFTDGGDYSSGNITVPTGAGIGELTGGTANISADNTVINKFNGGNLALTSGAKVKVKEGVSSGVISGTGALVKQGTGVLELTAANTYTAKTEITEGTLKVSSKNASTGVIDGLGSHTDLALGSGSSESKLSIAATGAATLDKNIIASSTDRTGAGNILENSGTGLLTVTGSLTKDGTVLTLAGGANGINVTGNIIGASSGSDLIVSSGVVTVSSSNSYNGPTFVQAGATLIADNASATGTGIVNVANGATLQVGTAANILTLTTGGFALTNGAHIKVYVDHVDITGLTANSGAGIDTRYTHYDLTNTAGTAYSTLFTNGALDLTGVTAGGITIDVYSANANTDGLLFSPFYDFKFLEATTVTGLGSGLTISELFTINTDNLKYATGSNSVAAQYNGSNLSDLIKVYTVNNGGNTVLMMSIPEPSTYGLGLGALALAAVAIRRRKQKQKKATV